MIEVEVADDETPPAVAALLRKYKEVCANQLETVILSDSRGKEIATISRKVGAAIVVKIAERNRHRVEIPWNA